MNYSRQAISRRVVLTFAAALPAALSAPVFAQPIGESAMEYLGQANVDGRYDHDKIKVNGVFRAVQLRVERGPIEFDRVIVHYGNGQAEDIPVRSRIPAGGRTRVIDLPGERRLVKSVEIYYAKARYREYKPKVRLFGTR